jgi:hypothetical protein
MGKRIYMKLTGIGLMKVYLDKAQQEDVNYKDKLFLVLVRSSQAKLFIWNLLNFNCEQKLKYHS